MRSPRGQPAVGGMDALPLALQGLPGLLSDEGALSDGEWEAEFAKVL